LIEISILYRFKKKDEKKKMRIVTHSGKIHSDEVASIALLTGYFAHKNVDVSVLRTRDPENFLETDILVDVGLEYDHNLLRYDHHQKDFNEKWSNDNGDRNNIPLSSAGLVWRHYGSEIIEMYLDRNSDYSEQTINDLKNIIYYKLIEEIDANDNGISYESSYISDLVSALNTDINDNKAQNENFNRAVELVGNIFDIKFNEIISSYFNFQKDLEIVREMDLSGAYLVIEENIPTVFKCLRELDPECKVKFCIFIGENEYTVKTRRQNGNKFQPICPILESDDPDVVFVHKAGFLAKTKSLDAAKFLVNNSLLYSADFMVDTRKINLQTLKDKRVIGGGLALTSLAALGFLYWNTNE